MILISYGHSAENFVFDGQALIQFTINSYKFERPIPGDVYFTPCPIIMHPSYIEYQLWRDRNNGIISFANKLFQMSPNRIIIYFFHLIVNFEIHNSKSEMQSLGLLHDIFDSNQKQFYKKSVINLRLIGNM